MVTQDVTELVGELKRVLSPETIRHTQENEDLPIGATLVKGARAVLVVADKDRREATFCDVGTELRDRRFEDFLDDFGVSGAPTGLRYPNDDRGIR